MLYASLYWRARYAINNLARIHFITPALRRLAVVRQETEFEPSGLFYTRPDWTNMAFANWVQYPDHAHSAHAGERLPIAKIPDGIKFKPGDENVYAGRGQFYRCRYGPYLIGMNCTTDRSFELKLPEGGGTRLPDGQAVTGVLTVGPRSTVVVRVGT